MTKLVFKSLGMLMVAALVFLAACQETESVVDDQIVEDFSSQALYEIQKEGNCGKMGCYEFVFPISITFVDETSVEVNSYEELKESVKAWKEANPESTERPTLNFPLEVIDSEGEVILVESRDDLRELRQECRRDFFARHGHREHRRKGTHCFSLVWPLTIVFPDETEATAEDRGELHTILREWKAANQEATERPELKFPLTVKLEDGTEQEVESRDALKALKETCSAS